MIDNWAWWDVNHTTADQSSRFSRGCSPSCTPHQIDKERGIAVFFGEDQPTYQTSIRSCSCTDFQQREIPCKHMYRLAMELGQLSAPEGLVLGKLQSDPPPEKNDNGSRKSKTYTKATTWNWSCRECGRINPPKNNFCENCNARRPFSNRFLAPRS